MSTFHVRLFDEGDGALIVITKLASYARDTDSSAEASKKFKAKFDVCR